MKAITLDQPALGLHPADLWPQWWDLWGAA